MKMRISKYLVISGLALLLASCGQGKIDRPDAILTNEEKALRESQVDAPTVPNTPIASSGGIKHYICPNGHEGSNAQGQCIVCGSTLEHNQEFHNQPASAQNSGSDAEPPQNASGVWHYTCPNGSQWTRRRCRWWRYSVPRLWSISSPQYCIS